jgi:hypothetical protein
MGGGRTGNLQVPSGLSEAPTFDDPDEQTHDIDAIHDWPKRLLAPVKW